MEVRVELVTVEEEDDRFLTLAKRMGLAKVSISQLLWQIKEKLGVDLYTLHLILETESARMARIGRGDEDWEGHDLAKAKREAAKRAATGSKVMP